MIMLVDEIIRLENKMVSYFENANKDIVMTQEDGEYYRNFNFCTFCEKKQLLIKLEIIVT